jgi:hypothetical protein
MSKNASYRQAKSPPGCGLPRYTEKSTEKSTEKWTSQVLPTSQKLTGRKPTETRTEKSSEKSTGKVRQVDHYSTEAAYRDRNQKSTVKSTKKSTTILLKPPIKSNYEVDRMVSEADFQRRLPHHAASISQCHYRLQDILYRACGNAAQSSDNASALELGKYNHFRETYVLDSDE